MYITSIFIRKTAKKKKEQKNPSKKYKKKY